VIGPWSISNVNGVAVSFPRLVTLDTKTRSSTRKLHKRLHTYRTFDEEQVDLNAKTPTCGAFAEPSDGLEPSTPSLPWRCSTN
jgi:hypothetical protein